jgi:GTP-binding protein
MRIEFIKSAALPEQFPRHTLPEITLAGRSNVGKSSLINRLAGGGGIARVSKRPGCTRMLNFFSLGGKACLVDMPGYGFARVSRDERGRWSEIIETYLEERDNLSGVVVIMDANIPPTELDLEMLNYAKTLGVPVLPVATKADRIPKSRRKAALAAFASQLGNGVDQVLAFSAENGDGLPELARWIASACGLARLA